MTVNTGTINMPSLLRQLSHRTNNVRDVVFQRDAIFNKSSGTVYDEDGYKQWMETEQEYLLEDAEGDDDDWGDDEW